MPKAKGGTKEQPPIEVTVAGRSFRMRPTSVSQNLFVFSRLRKAKIDQMVQQFDPLTTNVEQFSQDIVVAAYESGQLFTVLGGLLVDDAKAKWTEADAIENAAFFADLTGDDATMIAEPIAAVVLSFFMNALGSFTTSPKSSGVLVKTPGAESSTFAAQNNDFATSDESSAEAGGFVTSTSGMGSSGNSPDTTPTSSTGSSRGRSGKPSSRTSNG